ncbi:acetyltransferase [Kitasatospora sp. MMS16-BH015]|uniref:GNAT family N-acetyltransferase n=1 Tax=Kitasatospora sp. MMS16-BH015 TaxID=2018025 RepID=UPI000CA14157|nr:GNAT family N-acetyltransferase [Kitasatospora sp. MMS16-BH015]AUG76559.1 acetyltransferase [Kitasatospora sp. MMS16-BH015]
MAEPSLPSPYRGRPATPADAPAIHRLVAAGEQQLFGLAETGPDRIAAELALPGLDPALDTRLALDAAGEPVGWAWVRGRRSTVDVHPAHRGRGLGGALLDWAEERAREAGTDRLSQTVPDADRAGVGLLRARGYEPFVTEWQLAIELAAEPPEPEPLPGVTVRPFRAGDERAAYLLTEDAFDDWQQRRKSYPEWAALSVERDTFAPALSPLAFAGGELVGVVLALATPGSAEGYVERVAVRKDHRHRGIARLLLREAFRASYRRGHRSCTLWTHSETGALGLYESVGMTVRRSSAVYGRPLAGGQTAGKSKV